MLASVHLIALEFLLFQMLFPLLALLSAAVRAREAIKLFGVGYLELVLACGAHYRDLFTEEAVDYLQAVLFSDATTLLVELLTAVAPGFVA